MRRKLHVSTYITETQGNSHRSLLSWHSNREHAGWSVTLHRCWPDCYIQHNQQCRRRTCTADSWWSESPALAHPANNTLFSQILICTFHDNHKHIDQFIWISIAASPSTFICSSSSPPSSLRPPLPVICTSWLDPTCGHLLISGGQRPISEFIFVLTACLWGVGCSRVGCWTMWTEFMLTIS